MKTLNEYLRLPYRMEIVEDRNEGGFVVSYPDLPGCITCGETVESAVANAQDAKRAWLEAALEDGIPIREPDYEVAPLYFFKDCLLIDSKTLFPCLRTGANDS